MARITVEAEVHADEFDTYDLLEELSTRNLSKLDKDETKFLNLIVQSSQLNVSQNLTNHSLLHQMKIEVINANLDKYTLEEIEKFFRS